jgi:hypothetical protein
MRNTSLIGERSRMRIISALAAQDKNVLVPLSEFLRYDLVIDEGGRFLRVQCKTGHLMKGAIVFNPCSIDSRSKAGGCIRKGYKGEVELFGVYCPELKKCYLVPVGHTGNTACSLRVDSPKNGQKTKIRWAEDYELRAD